MMIFAVLLGGLSGVKAIVEMATIEFQVSTPCDYQMLVAFRTDVNIPFATYIQKTTHKSFAERDVVDLIKCLLPVSWHPHRWLYRNLHTFHRCCDHHYTMCTIVTPLDLDWNHTIQILLESDSEEMRGCLPVVISNSLTLASDLLLLRFPEYNRRVLKEGQECLYRRNVCSS